MIPAVLYKVARPREDATFHPTRFWHTADWESSTPKPRKGYIEDCVLFLGDFDEINIHLLPRKKSVRVRCKDANYTLLQSHGLQASPGKTAYIFVDASTRQELEAFQPTIYAFENTGFENVRKGEYISRTSLEAVSSETVTMQEVVTRWNIEICFVDDLDFVIATLKDAGIYFDVQT